MRTGDVLRYALGAIRATPVRSALTALGITIGITAVVILTSLGGGLRRYVLEQFSQFGTDVVAVTPGRTTTLGVSGALINTVRPLTLDDAAALARLPGVRDAVPLVAGNAAAEFGRRSRRTMLYGVGPDMPAVWRFRVAAGRFLPRDDVRRPRSYAVLGASLRRELFGDAGALGGIVRVGGYRFRVVGVLSPKGRFLGFDLDDALYVPAALGLEVFDRVGLMEIDVVFEPGVDPDRGARRIRALLRARHGREDFTVVTQKQMLDVLDSVMSVLGAAVLALGGISLVVGGVGVVTIVNLAAQERMSEIGLLQALGATRAEIVRLLLVEAGALAGLGGLAGLVLGLGSAGITALLAPGVPVAVTLPAVPLAEGTAITVGVLAAVLPAYLAARRDPIEALREE